jgi:hypothetical protein
LQQRTIGTSSYNSGGSGGSNELWVDIVHVVASRREEIIKRETQWGNHARIRNEVQCMHAGAIIFATIGRHSHSPGIKADVCLLK